MDSVNVITCTDVNQDTYNLGKLFNIIYMNSRNRVTFSLAGVFCTDEMQESMHLHVIMQQRNGNQYTVLGSLEIYDVDMTAGFGRIVFKLPVEDLMVPEIGEYRIDIYRDDNIADCDLQQAAEMLSRRSLGTAYISIQ